MQSDCTNWYSYQGCLWIPTAPHSTFLSSLGMGYLFFPPPVVSVKWYLIVLVCVSLVTNNDEHIFINVCYWWESELCAMAISFGTNPSCTYWGSPFNDKCLLSTSGYSLTSARISPKVLGIGISLKIALSKFRWKLKGKFSSPLS